MENFTLRDQKSMMMLTQFEEIIRAKHNTQLARQIENYDFVLRVQNKTNGKQND